MFAPVPVGPITAGALASISARPATRHTKSSTECVAPTTQRHRPPPQRRRHPRHPPKTHPTSPLGVILGLRPEDPCQAAPTAATPRTGPFRPRHDTGAAEEWVLGSSPRMTALVEGAAQTATPALHKLQGVPICVWCNASLTCQVDAPRVFCSSSDHGCTGESKSEARTLSLADNAEPPGNVPGGFFVSGALMCRPRRTASPAAGRATRRRRSACPAPAGLRRNTSASAPSPPRADENSPSPPAR